MSEMPPEPQGGDGRPGMMSSRIMGIPAPLFVAGVAVLAYFLFFRNSASSAGSASGGGGTPSTGNITLSPPAVNVNISGQAQAPSGLQKHSVSNPQPRPQAKPKVKKTVTPVQHKAGAPVFATVAKWKPSGTPWNSTLWGISQHYHTSIADLLKLNPKIANPNVIYAGQKIRVK